MEDGGGAMSEMMEQSGQRKMSTDAQAVIVDDPISQRRSRHHHLYHDATVASEVGREANGRSLKKVQDSELLREMRSKFGWNGSGRRTPSFLGAEA
ncbi:hypothetical protein ACFX14_002397 [Malus domestica]